MARDNCAIHPSFGALAGGTALTIEGVNFTAPATVLIGGKLASNITVLNPSQIACLTPSNFVYGTVPVVVQTATGSTTNANGFSYGVERGNGIELRERKRRQRECGCRARQLRLHRRRQLVRGGGYFKSCKSVAHWPSGDAWNGGGHCTVRELCFRRQQRCRIAGR